MACDPHRLIPTHRCDEFRRDLCALGLIGDVIHTAAMSFSATCARSDSSVARVDTVVDMRADSIDLRMAERPQEHG